jgi:cytoskeletal protein RodZ
MSAVLEPTSAEADAAAGRAPEREDSFGQYLQAIRIQKQIRLEQVAEQTRIRPAILEALERDDFDHLPPPVFAVGFLKAYAQAIGADGYEAVRRYQAQLRLRQNMLGAEPPAKARRRPAPGRLVIIALAVLVALAAACLAVYRQWPGAPSAAPPAPAPVAEEPAAPPAENPGIQPPLEAAKSPPSPLGPKHRLTIAAHENSWVKVVIDQGAASEHKLKAGDRLRLEAQSGFNLLIGNVGGVKLSLDDQPVTIPGKRGEVVNIHLP